MATALNSSLRLGASTGSINWQPDSGFRRLREQQRSLGQSMRSETQSVRSRDSGGSGLSRRNSRNINRWQCETGDTSDSDSDAQVRVRTNRSSSQVSRGRSRGQEIVIARREGQYQGGVPRAESDRASTGSPYPQSSRSPHSCPSPAAHAAAAVQVASSSRQRAAPRLTALALHRVQQYDQGEETPTTAVQPTAAQRAAEGFGAQQSGLIPAHAQPLGQRARELARHAGERADASARQGRRSSAAGPPAGAVQRPGAGLPHEPYRQGRSPSPASEISTGSAVAAWVRDAHDMDFEREQEERRRLEGENRGLHCAIEEKSRERSRTRKKEVELTENAERAAVMYEEVDTRLGIHTSGFAERLEVAIKRAEERVAGLAEQAHEARSEASSLRKSGRVERAKLERECDRLKRVVQGTRQAVFNSAGTTVPQGYSPREWDDGHRRGRKSNDNHRNVKKQSPLLSPLQVPGRSAAGGVDPPVDSDDASESQFSIDGPLPDQPASPLQGEGGAAEGGGGGLEPAGGANGGAVPGPALQGEARAQEQGAELGAGPGAARPDAPPPAAPRCRVAAARLADSRRSQAGGAQRRHPTPGSGRPRRPASPSRSRRPASPGTARRPTTPPAQCAAPAAPPAAQACGTPRRTDSPASTRRPASPGCTRRPTTPPAHSASHSAPTPRCSKVTPRRAASPRAGAGRQLLLPPPAGRGERCSPKIPLVGFGSSAPRLFGWHASVSLTRRSLSPVPDLLPTSWRSTTPRTRSRTRRQHVAAG
eukprot:TRINITY_DN11354_c0_g1_i1.p1 TRINITY_DN11354_c0_g1~~TRINITY_DN11354_c0_g1_i1.p1  ORF type:complete len:793 (+),score=101.87 TRINITY_DN11354_c0_g1_i1:87-2381(+)